MNDYMPTSYLDTMSSLARRAQKLRILQKLTQQELALKSNVAISTLRRFEKTGNVSLENTLRIAFALNVEADFEQLFQSPKYFTLDEALAEPRNSEPRRVRKSKRTSIK